jgi:hypothetical protein
MSDSFYIDIENCAKKTGSFLVSPTDIYSKILEKADLKLGVDAFRKNQGLKGELCEVLYREKNWFFIRMEDKTLGWALSSNIKLIEADFKFKLSPAGEVFVGSSFPSIEELKKYLNIPYLAGGRSNLGFDCSGFTQMIFSKYFDIYLPKHSWDQRAYGIEVEGDKYLPFDIIFTKDIEDNNIDPKLEKGKHVSIFVGDGMIIHSSVGQNGVAITPLKDLLDKFKIKSVRRVVVSKEAFKAMVASPSLLGQ